jgi:hypothetical protein
MTRRVNAVAYTASLVSAWAKPMKPILLAR